MKRWVEKVARRIGYDRRCRFYDLSSVEREERVARSSIIQFYSAVDNIGNYLPVLGIRNVLGMRTDTWNIHDEGIDFDFINQNYKCAIIGGAGLLHSCFEPFWKRFAEKCKIPYIVWGVGGCFPDDEDDPSVAPRVASPVLEGADLTNVRDRLTADLYGLLSAHISPCPTVAYLSGGEGVINHRNGVLYSSHTGLVSKDEQSHLHGAVKGLAEKMEVNLLYTDNVQRRLYGMKDIIDNKYRHSRVVITTRLHGAIVAYSLGIPYVAVARDDKLREFGGTFGNGVCIDNIEDVEEGFTSLMDVRRRPVMRSDVYEFGKMAAEWVYEKVGAKLKVGRDA